MIGLGRLLGGAAASLLAAASSAEQIVVGQTFLARSTDPTEGSDGWALVSHGVAQKLFTVNRNDEIVPQVGASVKKVSELEWDVTLKPDVKFSDGTPVTAANVAACLTELEEKNDSATSSLGSFTATPLGELDGAATVGMDAKDDDGLTFRIKSERATHVMDAVLAEWVFAIFLDKGNGEFVYTGPYAIDTFGEDQIDIVPNEYYDDRAGERPDIAIMKAADPHELAKELEAGEIDIGFHLPIDTLPELRKADGVRIKSFEVGYHYMAFHNIDNVPDVRVRRAIDHAIDRNALSQALAGGNPTRSLFPDYSPYFSDDSDMHGDPDAAAALLDEAGWTLDADTGMRTKDGEVLTVRLVTYPQRPGLGIMLPVVADALEGLGIETTTKVTGDEWSETEDIIEGRDFDLLLWAQHTLPAGDPLYFLSSFFRSNGGSNHAGLKSESVDGLLDNLSGIEDHEERVAATADAHAEILDEVAVSNLVTPKWHVGLNDRMKDYEPWGSDYYVIRPDLFLSPSEGGEGGDDVAVEEAGSSARGPGGATAAVVVATALFASVRAVLAF